MDDKADRADTEIQTSNAQNRPLANERSQHNELPPDFQFQTSARLGDMSEARGNGDTASEAPSESVKVFTMLGNTPRSMILHTYLALMAIRKQPRSHE